MEDKMRTVLQNLKKGYGHLKSILHKLLNKFTRNGDSFVSKAIIIVLTFLISITLGVSTILVAILMLPMKNSFQRDGPNYSNVKYKNSYYARKN